MDPKYYRKTINYCYTVDSEQMKTGWSNLTNAIDDYVARCVFYEKQAQKQGRTITLKSGDEIISSYTIDENKEE